MIAEEVIPSFSIPNLPGYKLNNSKSWIYKEIEKVGFKRQSPISRPQSAQSIVNSTAWAKASANNFKNSNQDELTNDEIIRSRPSTAGNSRSQMFYKTTNSTYNGSPKQSTSTFVKPKYIEMDQKVCRFYGYFLQPRLWDELSALGKPAIESDQCRHVTILYYLVDDTIEINERKVVNSGMSGGRFFRRGKVTTNSTPDNSNRLVELRDFSPGSTIDMIGQTFFIADADVFTRKYFQDSLNIELPPPTNQPAIMRSDMGVAYATGMGANLRNETAFVSSSADFQAQREGIEKAKKFFKHEGKVLRFLCVEVKSTHPPFFPELNHKFGYGDGEVVAPAKAKRFVVSYHLSSGSIDLLLQSAGNGKKDTSSLDDPKLILKKTKLPLNWREAQKGGLAGGFYEPSHLHCGETVDIYGRIFLLVNCDDLTRRYYEEELGVTQSEVPLLTEEEEKVVHAVPVLGDGFLPIGSAEDTLSTVYGKPKARKDEKKMMRNHGRLIRCKAVLCTDNLVNKSREFFITMFLEDDSLQVFEDAKRNSGQWGGTFLKRGKYLNELPPDSDPGSSPAPRPFQPQDMFLGNVLCVNGTMFRIVEIDNVSLNFCESYPEEFPMSDAQRILSVVLGKCMDSGVDLRQYLQEADPLRLGRLSRESIISKLDSMQLVAGLNDHELLTLLRRFRASEPQQQPQGKEKERKEFYVYTELCDHLSQLYASQGRGGLAQGARAGQVPAFLRNVRTKYSLQLRRVLRKNKRSVNGTVPWEALERVLSKNGLYVSSEVRNYLLSNFSAAGADGDRLIREVQQQIGGLLDRAEVADLKVPPRPHAVSFLKERIKQTFSSSNLNKSSNSIRAQTDGINTAPGLKRNSIMATSLLRGPRAVAVHPSSEASTPISGGQDTPAGPSELGQTINLINYEKLCDHIYPCDWI